MTAETISDISEESNTYLEPKVIETETQKLIEDIEKRYKNDDRKAVLFCEHFLSQKETNSFTRSEVLHFYSLCKNNATVALLFDIHCRFSHLKTIAKCKKEMGQIHALIKKNKTDNLDPFIKIIRSSFEHIEQKQLSIDALQQLREKKNVLSVDKIISSETLPDDIKALFKGTIENCLQNTVKAKMPIEIKLYLYAIITYLCKNTSQSPVIADSAKQNRSYLNLLFEKARNTMGPWEANVANDASFLKNLQKKIDVLTKEERQAQRRAQKSGDIISQTVKINKTDMPLPEYQKILEVDLNEIMNTRQPVFSEKLQHQLNHLTNEFLCHYSSQIDNFLQENMITQIRYAKNIFALLENTVKGSRYASVYLPKLQTAIAGPLENFSPGSPACMEVILFFKRFKDYFFNFLPKAIENGFIIPNAGLKNLYSYQTDLLDGQKVATKIIQLMKTNAPAKPSDSSAPKVLDKYAQADLIEYKQKLGAYLSNTLDAERPENWSVVFINQMKLLDSELKKTYTPEIMRFIIAVRKRIQMTIQMLTKIKAYAETGEHSEFVSNYAGKLAKVMSNPKSTETELQDIRYFTLRHIKILQLLFRKAMANGQRVDSIFLFALKLQ